MRLWQWLAILCMVVSAVGVRAQTDSAPVTAQAFRAINVRSGPGTGFEVVRQLPEGVVVTVLGRSDAGSNWLLIEREGESGWVAYFTVTLTGDVNSLPIVSRSAASTLTAPLDTSSAVSQFQAVQPVSSSLYVTAYRRVNLRSGPGTAFPIIGVLPPGSTADIIETSGASNEWLKLRYDGQEGWVAYFVVTVTGDLETLNTADTLVTTTATDTDGIIVITRYNTNLRDRPALDADVITVVPYQTTVTAEARTARGDWLRVRFGDSVGWLIASLVNAGAGDLNGLPIVSAS